MGCGYCLCHEEAVMTSSRAVLGVKWKDLDEKKKKKKERWGNRNGCGNISKFDREMEK